jgi:TM2 domain-containing membrane protein YozV
MHCRPYLHLYLLCKSFIHSKRSTASKCSSWEVSNLWAELRGNWGRIIQGDGVWGLVTGGNVFTQLRLFLFTVLAWWWHKTHQNAGPSWGVTGSNPCPKCWEKFFGLKKVQLWLSNLGLWGYVIWHAVDEKNLNKKGHQFFGRLHKNEPFPEKISGYGPAKMTNFSRN